MTTFSLHQRLVNQLTKEKEKLEQSIQELEASLGPLEEHVNQAKEREKLLVEYPDLNGPVNPDYEGMQAVVMLIYGMPYDQKFNFWKNFQPDWKNSTYMQKEFNLTSKRFNIAKTIQPVFMDIIWLEKNACWIIYACVSWFV